MVVESSPRFSDASVTDLSDILLWFRPMGEIGKDLAWCMHGRVYVRILVRQDGTDEREPRADIDMQFFCYFHYLLICFGFTFEKM